MADLSKASGEQLVAELMRRAHFIVVNIKPTDGPLGDLIEVSVTPDVDTVRAANLLAKAAGRIESAGPDALN